MAKMGRPPKPKDQLLNVPLRVMLSASQRDIIAEGARIDGFADVSTWARRVLLDTATRRAARAKK
jgi:hypothetical protein